ncbi:MAG: HlyC/CorC family transporter, partial [Actinomycetia bacterium]|nr:HlyC/CorC family transporter [Actinomycetes bacterium]
FVASGMLIGLNGVYVAYEFAILAAKRSTFSAPTEIKKRTSVAALASMSDLSMQLAGAQLGITMASLALGFVGEPAFEAVISRALGSAFSEEMTHVVGIVGSLSIVVFLHLVLGEMVPKNIALATPDTTLRWLVLPYRAFLWLFRPFIRLLNGMANAGCRLVGVEPRDELVTVHSASELAAIVTHSRAEGTIEDEDADLLSGALHFAQRQVGEVATPLSELITMRLGATAAQAERVVTTSGRERIPIYGPEADGTLAGYVHARDLFRLDPDQRLSPIPADMIRSMAIVSQDQPLIEVLRTLRRVRRQLAVVVDGDEAVGIISVEDLVKALMEPTPAKAVEPRS